MVITFERKKTSTIIVMYSLYLYFLGLSLRKTSNSLDPFRDKKEVMFLSGIGFKDLVHARFIAKEKEFQHSS
ncbi:MAG TPA: hypothetical protein VFK40_05600 [Nitrososphaeraceae archaeon]|nr:hypothetical protein [Nitrososphaeraceae archaeon]